MAFIPGDNWVICDRCGEQHRRSVIRKEWTGLMVCPGCYDPKPIYRSVPSDNIPAKDPRPRQEPTFLTPENDYWKNL